MSDPGGEGPVLALDSCGVETTLALGRLAGTRLEMLRERSLAARTAGSLLTRELREMLEGLKPTQLSAIVVVRGPGSFTGMRIGLSAAKALSEACAVPLVGVSRLAVLAGTSGAGHVALYAGRGNIYLRSVGIAPGTEEQLLTADQARGATAAGARQLAACEEKVLLLLPEARRVAEPTAANAMQHALPRLLAGQWDDAATLDALYLWREEQMLGQQDRAL